MTADFGHFYRIENGKIAEFHIFDDSQKWLHRHAA